MINSQELRIGNWLCWDKKIMRQVMPSTFGLSDYELKKQYSPIPLSPGIINKAGFETGWLNLEECGVSLGWDCYNDTKTVSIYEGSYGGIFGKPIRYLHQLQNLYYALTNKELIINL